MNEKLAIAKTHLDQDGFVLVPDLFDAFDAKNLIERIEQSLIGEGSSPSEKSIKSRQGKVYAARNLHEVIDGFDSLWMRPTLVEVVAGLLGSDFGLVRALYFDKHPERTWSLPWHRDKTITVKDNSLSSKAFTKPTTKSGVPHVEAPDWLLKKMVTARIHLDDVDDTNGPLIVRSGDFCEADDRPHRDVPVHCQKGDTLFMKPLLLHCSPSSQTNTARHRRIVHLEFSSVEELVDGYCWRTFQRPIY